MDRTAKHDAWSAGQSYEHYMGRWSRRIATKFVKRLDAPGNLDWLDVGCGTGALTAAILDQANPGSVLGIDPADGFIAHARAAITDPRARFEVGDAQALPADAASADIVTSALAINFVPDKTAALREMQRVVRPGGRISFYVWDYPGGGMGFIDAFWKAAAAIDPKAADLDEGKRFPFCTADGLATLCSDAGLSATVAPIEVETVFPTFEDFWEPFTLGAGPAPGYCASLPDDARQRLKERLADDLGGDGPVTLTARAWSVTAKH